MIESIDLDDTRGAHWHKWIKRIVKKDRKETREKIKEDYFTLKPSLVRFIKYAKEWEENNK